MNEIERDVAQLAKLIQRLVRREVATLIAGGEVPTLESLRRILRGAVDQPARVQPRFRYRVTAQAPKGHLTPAGKEILEVLKGYPDKTVAELVIATHLARKTVENNLAMLRAAGVLRTVDA